MRPATFKDLFDADQPPPHPGEILREDVFPRLALSQTALARHLGISRTALSNVLRERSSISLDLAQRLGAALGSGPQFWLGLQTRFDLWHARMTPAAPVKRLAVVGQNNRRVRAASLPGPY